MMKGKRRAACAVQRCSWWMRCVGCRLCARGNARRCCRCTLHDADDSDEQCVMVSSSELRKRQDHGVNEDAMPDATRFICGQDLLSICYISSDTSLSEADRDQRESAISGIENWGRVRSLSTPMALHARAAAPSSRGWEAALSASIGLQHMRVSEIGPCGRADQYNPPVY